MSESLEKTVASIRALLPESLQSPTLSITCGSGLAGLVDLLEERVDVPYEKIDGFPASTVVGHQSKLCFGKLRGVIVVAQAGRYHTYEGKPLSLVVYPLRVFHALGCRTAILTNAAGGLNPDFAVPTIGIVRDHIALPALAGLNPLVGPNDDSVGPRFPPLSNAYDLDLQRMAYRASHILDLPNNLLQPVTYAWVVGPTYETKADCKFLREYCGADVVGMSTVPEVITARHMGMRVLALSLVTNKVVNTPYRDLKAEVAAEFGAAKEASASKGSDSLQKAEDAEAVSHEEVLEVGRQAAEHMNALVSTIVEMAGKDGK